MHIAHKQGAMQGSTGNFDHTVTTGFGTPVAALAVSVRAATIDTTAEAGVISFGGADSSSNQAAIVATVRDNVTSAANMTTAKRASNNETVKVTTDSVTTADATVDLASFGTDKTTWNQTDVGTANYQFSSIMFAGADVQEHIGTFTAAATQDTTVDVTWTSDFSPDFIFIWNNSAAFSDTNSTSAKMSLGGCYNDGGTLKNRCAVFNARNAVSPSEYFSRVSNTRCGLSMGTTGTINAAAEVTSMTLAGGGFTVTTRDAAGGDVYAYLALKFNSAQKIFWDFVTSPTGTGVKTLSDPGFAGKFAMMFMTRCAAIDTTEADADAGTFAVSIMDWQGLGHSACYSFCATDGATTTDSKSLASDEPIRVNNDAGTQIWVATRDSIGGAALGPSYNFSTNSATGLQWLLFYLGLDRIAVSTDIEMTLTSGLTATGALACTMTSSAVTVAADLTGIGALAAATPNVELVLTSGLTAIGSLASSFVGPEITTTAGLTAGGSIACAMTAPAVTVTAGLTGIGSLAATPNAEMLLTSNLTAPGGLAAGVNVEMTLVAGASGRGALAASVNAELVLTSDLQAQTPDIEASFNVEMVLTATLTAIGSLASNMAVEMLFYTVTGSPGEVPQIIIGSTRGYARGPSVYGVAEGPKVRGYARGPAHEGLAR